MKIITINLPKTQLKALKTLTDHGIYDSRSDAIRVALREFLDGELNLRDQLRGEEFQIDIRSSLHARGDN